jgi:hypothetical protein
MEKKKLLIFSCIAWALLVIIAFVLFRYPQFCIIEHNGSVRPGITLYIALPLLIFSGYVLGKGIASYSGLKHNSLIAIVVAVSFAISLTVSGFLYPFVVNEHFMTYTDQLSLKWAFRFVFLTVFLATLLIILGLIREIGRFLFATKDKERDAYERKV